VTISIPRKQGDTGFTRIEEVGKSMELSGGGGVGGGAGGGGGLGHAMRTGSGERLVKEGARRLGVPVTWVVAELSKLPMVRHKRKGSGGFTLPN